MNNYFIFDFDSTLVGVESLDVLAGIVLQKNKDKKKIVDKISAITAAGMDGSISFTDSLEERLKLFQPTKDDLELLIQILKKNISISFLLNQDFFKEHQQQIYVVSGGFKEFIVPVVKLLGISEENVFANTFIAYTEHVRRAAVLSKTSFVAESFIDVLQIIEKGEK